MPRLFTDNAVTTLATGIDGIETEMTVSAGQGANFPVVDGTDANYFVLTMEDAAGNLEFIRVDHRVGDVLGSVTYPNTRAYDGSSAQAWIALDIVDLRWTSASMNSIYLPTQDLIPETTNLYDIGSAAFRFKDLFLEGDIDTNGLVDGRAVLTDGTKLDTIDWTGAAIKALYEAEVNAYTDVKDAILAAIFHVGYVMLSAVSTNPAALGYPGVWAQIAMGRTIIGAGAGAGLTARTAGAELGSENAVNVSHGHSVTDPGHVHGVTDPGHNHAITDPGHRHGVPSGENGNGSGGYDDANNSRLTPRTEFSDTGITINNRVTSVTVNNGVTGLTVVAAGVTGTGANMQPSLVTYIWQRTS